MTWLDDRAAHKSPVRVDPDGMIRSKFVVNDPRLRHVSKRWWTLHVHVYHHRESMLDPVTLEPKPGAGPCVNILRCRCGDEIMQQSYVSMG